MQHAKKILDWMMQTEINVNRVINTGMQPYKLLLVDFEVLKLTNVSNSKVMQLEVKNIKTIRQRRITASGAQLPCVDIYLHSTKNVVFAFQDEGECKAFTNGLRICAEWVNDLEALRSMMK